MSLSRRNVLPLIGAAALAMPSVARAQSADWPKGPLRIVAVAAWRYRWQPAPATAS